MASRVNADKAVAAMRFYLGSVDYNSVRDQQKLYTRVQKEVDKLSTKTGIPTIDVWEKVEREARRLGIVRPIPGKNV